MAFGFRLPYRWVKDPEVQGNFEAIEKVLGAAPAAPVTALPTATSALEGAEVTYVADAVNGVLWTFRCRYAGNGSAYKWEYKGGSPIYRSGNSANTVSDTPVAIPGMGTFTAPFSGQYSISYQFTGGIAGAANGGGAALNGWNDTSGVALGGSIVAGTGGNWGADARKFDSAFGVGTPVTIAAGTVFTTRMSRSTPDGTGTAYVWYPAFFVEPVRVG